MWKADEIQDIKLVIIRLHDTSSDNKTSSSGEILHTDGVQPLSWGTNKRMPKVNRLCCYIPYITKMSANIKSPSVPPLAPHALLSYFLHSMAHDS
jgi:hypothetical protein